MDRYVVTELSGFATMTTGRGTPGLSCMVLDTVYNRRVLRTWRSEDYAGPSHGNGKETARGRATAYAASLNQGNAPPTDPPKSGFRPTCPSCAARCDVDAIYCGECDARLYPKFDTRYKRLW